MKITIECKRKAVNKMPSLHLVKFGGVEDEHIIGLLEKYNNTRTEQHPWKAFLGWGMNTTYLGSFYPNEGGRKAALQAILDRASVGKAIK